jgi:hypothetical protein
MLQTKITRVLAHDDVRVHTEPIQPFGHVRYPNAEVPVEQISGNRARWAKLGLNFSEVCHLLSPTIKA